MRTLLISFKISIGLIFVEFVRFFIKISYIFFVHNAAHLSKKRYPFHITEPENQYYHILLRNYFVACRKINF